jgi:hypothetical protein
MGFGLSSAFSGDLTVSLEVLVSIVVLQVPVEVGKHQDPTSRADLRHSQER